MSRVALFCCSFLQTTVSVVAQVCDMTSSVPLLFPEGQLYGFGNSGLYRTDGLVLNLQCTYKGTGTGTMAILHQHEPLDKKDFSISNNSNSIFTLKYFVTHPIGGAEYWCECELQNNTIISNNTVKVPNLQPCDEDECQSTSEMVCYHSSWNSDHVKSLKSIHWNEGAPYSRLMELKNTLIGTASWKEFNGLYRKSTGGEGLCHRSGNANNIIEKVETGNETALLDYYDQLTNNSDSTDPCRPDGLEPPFTRTLAKQCSLMDMTPMTINGKMLYIGSVHYVEATDHLVLEVGIWSGTGEVECTMYSWERGTDPTEGTSAMMYHELQDNHVTSTNRTWHIRGEDIPKDSNTINLIGCIHKSAVKPGSKLPQHLLQVKQAEFFVRWHAKVNPIYNEDEYLVGCSTETNGQAITTKYVRYTASHCTCVFPPIVNCNPVKTVNHIAARLKIACKRSGPEQQTRTTAPSRLGYTPHAQSTDDTNLWVIVGVIIALVLFNTSLFVHYCINTKMLRDRARTANAKEGDEDESLAPYLINNSFFYDSASDVKDKLFSDGSVKDTESVPLGQVKVTHSEPTPTSIPLTSAESVPLGQVKATHSEPTPTSIPLNAGESVPLGQVNVPHPEPAPAPIPLTAVESDSQFQLTSQTLQTELSLTK